jgi:hypothetical protein
MHQYAIGCTLPHVPACRQAKADPSKQLLSIHLGYLK